MVTDSESTFKRRVLRFWQWYAEHSQRFKETIDRGEAPTLAEEVSHFLEQTLPGLSWSFGPGELDGHSFTLSGEGDVAKQILTEYWLQQAASVNNWTFYASRQPCTPESLQSMAIQIGPSESIDAAGFIIATTPDDEAQKFDVLAWHPLLGNVPEDHRMQILFLLLDEALGEFGTSQWIGSVELQPIPDGAKSMPLPELPLFLRQAEKYHRWEKLSPLESYAGYQVDEQNDGPRGDTFVGTTLIPDLIFDLMRQAGKLESNPLQDTGAQLAYLRLATASFSPGAEADERGNIEDAIDDALATRESGRVVGGAFGAEQTYIDMILFDGFASQQIVLDTVKKLNLQGKPCLEIVQ